MVFFHETQAEESQAEMVLNKPKFSPDDDVVPFTMGVNGLPVQYLEEYLLFTWRKGLGNG
jgi:hypothetical protein